MATFPSIDVSKITAETEPELSVRLYIYRKSANGYQMHNATIQDLSSILISPNDLSVISNKISELKTTISSFRNYLQQNYMTIEEAEETYDLDADLYNEIKDTWTTLQKLDEKLEAANLASMDYVNRVKQEVLKEEADARYDIMCDLKERILKNASSGE